MSQNKFVVLGLITTKRAELESNQLLSQRIAEASRYFPKEQLGLSPQCGFASSVTGNRISAQAQREKLELAVNTAKSVWT